MNNTLTWNQVQEIRKLLAMGYKNKEVAAMYGVKPNTISDIKRNKTWNGELTNEQVARIKLLLNKGMTVETIAEGFKVPVNTIVRIKRGETYTDVAPEPFEGEEWQVPESTFL
jgi:IS30 family transposase